MKKVKTYLTIIMSIVITLILFVLFNKEHFALDTYGFELDISKNAHWYLLNGRFIMTLFLKVCNFLSISCKNIKFISLIISLISLFASNVILSKNIKKYIDNEFSSIISTVIIYSPFIFEFYLFPEYTGIMSVAVLMSILAYVYITKYFDLKKLKYLFISVVFAFISVSSYQGVIGCFVALCSFYIVINYKDIKQFMIQNVFVVSVYGVVSLISLIITKVCGLARVSTVGYDLIKTIKNVIRGTYNLISGTSYIYPRYYFILIILLIFSLIIFYSIKSKNNKNILLTLYLIIMVILFSVAPQFLVRYDTVWIVPRSNIAMGMLFGILCLTYFSLNKNSNKSLYIVMFIIGVSFFLQFLGWYRIRNDHYYVNEINKKESKIIIDSIRNYEKLNNVDVKRIAVSNDSSVRYTIDGVETTSGDVNVRAFVFEWSIQDILNYYSNKTYEFIEPTLDFVNYCSQNNWDGFNKEQLKFVKDTLYICIY